MSTPELFREKVMSCIRNFQYNNYIYAKILLPEMSLAQVRIISSINEKIPPLEMLSVFATLGVSLAYAIFLKMKNPTIKRLLSFLYFIHKFKFVFLQIHEGNIPIFLAPEVFKVVKFFKDQNQSIENLDEFFKWMTDNRKIQIIQIKESDIQKHYNDFLAQKIKYKKVR